MSVFRQNIRRWLDAVWHNDRQKIDLLDAYMALRSQELLLADIALRGGVYGRTTNPTNETLLAWSEGRRSLALELLELAQCNPEQLRRLIETYAPK
jgi:hypothetical protein